MSWMSKKFSISSKRGPIENVEVESHFFSVSTKGQIMSECIYEIIDFPKYHRKNLIDFCPESLFRLGMLCTHLSKAALRIIKSNHMFLVYKTFQGRNLSHFFGGILENR